ncbi:MAG: hypothetical protein ACRD3F_13455 [Acidobacteriaceae bacterium]
MDRDLSSADKDTLLIQTVWKDLKDRATLFSSPLPHVFLRQEKQLIRLDDDAEAYKCLGKYGLQITQKHFVLVRSNIAARILAKYPPRPNQCYKLGAMLGDAIYINAGNHRVIRVGADAITEEQNGHSIIFSDEDLLPWPEFTAGNLAILADFQRHRVGLGYTPESPLCRALTLYLDEQESGMPNAYAQQLYFSRFLFHWPANHYSLWPISLATGPSDSGKSSAFERWLWLLYGPDRDAGALPAKYRDLISSLSNRSLCTYDNIDGGKLDSKERSEYIDALCGVATGHEADMAILYRTNANATFRIRTHLACTAVTTPFAREDLHRRILHFSIAPPANRMHKDALKESILAERETCLLETIARLQTILRAHLEIGSHTEAARQFRTVSKMAEYEIYTATCAKYEGWLPFHSAMWQEHARRYDQTITAESPLALLLRLWLGKNSRTGERVVTPEALWEELSGIAADLEIEMTYKSIATFGKNLKRNWPVLKALGTEFAGRAGHPAYCFRPPPDVMRTCEDVYRATRAAHTARLCTWSQNHRADDEGFDSAQAVTQ